MRPLILAALMALLAAPAMANDQQAFMAKALGALQQQRDSANNEVVNAQARLALVSDENAALRKEIEVLKARLDGQPKEPEQKQ